jgi:magnesium transporter
MRAAYHIEGRKLVTGPVEGALWIDLFRPTEAETAGLGVTIPTLAEMEEIEISNRLYRGDGADFLTVVLPGQSDDKQQIIGPVCFILDADRLITVRHHAPRPFETFADRADRSTAGCETAAQIFAGLGEEIIGRMADLLEGVGKVLDSVTHTIYRPVNVNQKRMQEALAQIGGEGEKLSRVRLGLLTMARALNHFVQNHGKTAGKTAGKTVLDVIKGEIRDIDALEVHANFLAQRLALASDTALGMINLAQNATSRTASVVAVLFLPPTLIASTYGMNFAHMPELAHPLGYFGALIAMVASAVLTWAVFKWKGWL